MHDRRKKLGAKLAGRPLLGFRTQGTPTEDSGSPRLTTAKVGTPAPSPPPPPKVGPNTDSPTTRASAERGAED